jgi:hypothetical protein
MRFKKKIHPTMLYGAKCWPTKRRHVQQLGVAEMRMLRWMCGHTRRDRVQNDDIQDRVGVSTDCREACPASFKMVWAYSTEASRCPSA